MKPLLRHRPTHRVASALCPQLDLQEIRSTPLTSLTVVQAAIPSDQPADASDAPVGGEGRTVITIEHTHAEGTLAAGTRRSDGTTRIIRSTRDGWCYSPNAGAEGAWFLPGSRDQYADRVSIERLADALRLAGYEVEVRVDDDPRSRTEIESDRMVSPVDCICSAWVSVPTDDTGVVPESAGGPCGTPPVFRMTLHHDGNTCGRAGMCVLPSPGFDGEAGSGEPWTEVWLLCAEHAREYRELCGGDRDDQPRPGITMRRLP